VVEYDDRLLGFEVGGRIQELSVQRGQDVVAGAPLMRLDDGLEAPIRDLRAAELAAAEAQLRLLKAGARGEELRAAAAEVAALASQEEMLQKNLQRQQSLLAQNALAQSALDDTSSQLRATQERRRALEERLQALRKGPRGDEIAAAVARVQGAQAGLAAQEARLARFVLRSPMAANVVDVQLEPGELVTPGAPAVTLADLDHPYVDVFVPQARVHEIKVGDEMRITVDGLGAPLSGRVEHIFPKTEFTPRYLFSDSERPNLVIRTRVRVDDPKRALHAGVPAFVTTATSSASGAQS
jgi:HlyD family secretion protein